MTNEEDNDKDIADIAEEHPKEHDAEASSVTLDISQLPSETVELISGAVVDTPFAPQEPSTQSKQSEALFVQPVEQGAFAHIDASIRVASAAALEGADLPKAKPRKAKVPLAPKANNPFAGTSADRASSTGPMDRVATPPKQQRSWGGAPAEKVTLGGPYAGTTPPGRAVPPRSAHGQLWADADEGGDAVVHDPYQDSTGNGE